MYFLGDLLYVCLIKLIEEYFTKGPRSSQLKMKFDVDLVKVKGHEVCGLARDGLEQDRFTTAHTNVQMFMLQNDDKTISKHSTNESNLL